MRLRRLLLLVSLALVAIAILAFVVLLSSSSSTSPTEIRLALDPEGSHVVAWTTHEPWAILTGSRDAVTLDGTDTRAGADHTTFLKGDGFPWLVGLTTHRVPLGHLSAGNHTYAIPKHDPISFHVASNDSLRIVVLGDTGLNEHDEAFARRAADEKPDLILHVGDLAYAYDDEWKWERWMDTLQPASSIAPFMPVPGNHEKEYGEDYRNYDARFDPAGLHRQSYDIGPAHIIHLDSEDMTPEQDAWLASDLEHVDRARTPWVIALLHRPLYSSGILHTSDKPARQHFENLFDQHHVDLVLTGHEHNYERTCPVLAETCQLRAPTYIVTGGGGATLYPDFLPKPAWSITRTATHEMLELDITRASLQGRAVKDDGTSLDEWPQTPSIP